MTDTVAGLVARIKYLHRRRVFMMTVRIRGENELSAFLRVNVFGWNRTLAKAESDEIKAQVKNAIDECRKWLRKAKKAGDNTPPLPDIGLDDEEVGLILMTLQAHAPFVEREDALSAQLDDLGQRLPVWCELVPGTDVLFKNQRGFGGLGLAIIVGEAGRDLADYRSPAALWTRLSIGMRDGLRQGGLPKSAAKAAWIEHQYNAERRSRIWTVGHSLMMQNGDGRYRAIYLARKEYEKQKAVAAGLQIVPKAKIPAGRAAEFMSLGHIDRRAQRVMEKELIKDLWIAWRRAGAGAVQPAPEMSDVITREPPARTSVAVLTTR